MQLEKYLSGHCSRRQLWNGYRTRWGVGRNRSIRRDAGGEGNGDVADAHLAENEDDWTMCRGKEGSEDGGDESGDGQYGGIYRTGSREQGPQAEYH